MDVCRAQDGKGTIMLHIPITSTTPVKSLTGDFLRTWGPKWSPGKRAVVTADIAAGRTRVEDHTLRQAAMLTGASIGSSRIVARASEDDRQQIYAGRKTIQSVRGRSQSSKLSAAWTKATAAERAEFLRVHGAEVWTA
jgi:hypothetical protein